MTDKIYCPHCKGKGFVVLSGVYAETLQKLRKLTQGKRGRLEYVVANMHAENYFDCSPTALNNRLKRLEELGFAKSERYGRRRRYVACDFYLTKM